MRGKPTTFWGKLERDDHKVVTQWHPLAAHCADVAACTEALLHHTLLRRRLATLAGRDDLDEVDVARLSALAALHDIGKFNRGFQRKGDPEPRAVEGHVAEVLALFCSDYPEKKRLFAQLPSADLQRWCDGSAEGAFELLTAAIGHHGRPVRWLEIAAVPALWQADSALDPFAGIASLVASVRGWFPAAFASPRGGLPDAPAFQHAFAGLVMLADWLGSDRRTFPYAEELGDRMPFASERAREAVRAIGLDAQAARASLGTSLPGFDRISSHAAPHEAQATTMTLGLPPQGGLTILESETGSGKTEAALGRFVQLFHAGLVDGMMFALPTRTAATQLHERVFEAVQRAFPDQSSRPPVVLAVPGYLQVDDDLGRRLPGFEVLWHDDDKERARHRGWAAEHPKRYLAGSIVVGTIDQVLLSSLRVGHAHLRATALLRHLLVVDEVHASDAYMNRILEAVLGFHLAAGGHAFLMSATLGTDVRFKLESAALGKKAIAAADRSLAAALAAPYPAIHHAAHGARPTVIPIANAGRPKTIHVTLEPIADHASVVASHALAAARAGARVIVLRNTVTDAVATQLALEGLATPADRRLLFRVDDVVTLHHARFARDDRTRLDQVIELRFGKDAPARGGVLAVTTQTVQQSLDLDADILFTDLAPMDVLLQRFGRVHRHPDKRDPDRPAGFDQPRAIVMTSETPLDETLWKTGEARGKHGVGTVYENVLILEATRQRLARNGTLKIPAQNRELVEVTTHPEELERLAQALGDTWENHRTKVTGKRLAATGLADLNLVDRKERFGECSFKRTDLTERIASRLGESDRRAVFEHPPLGPFGAGVRELILPGWLTRDVPPDPDLLPTNVRTAVSPLGAEVHFTFGPLLFVYDRLGLRRDLDSTPDPSEDNADA